MIFFFSDIKAKIRAVQDSSWLINIIFPPSNESGQLSNQIALLNISFIIPKVSPRNLRAHSLVLLLQMRLSMSI